MKTLTWLGWFSGVAGPGFTLVDQAAPAFNKPTRCMLTVDVYAVRLHQLTLRRQELFDRLHAVRYCLRQNFITISSSRADVRPASVRPASEQLASSTLCDRYYRIFNFKPCVIIWQIAKLLNCAEPKKKQKKVECRPMPNVMAALPNIVGALSSTPHSLADAHY